jgi:hypothetical protein
MNESRHLEECQTFVNAEILKWNKNLTEFCCEMVDDGFYLVQTVTLGIPLSHTLIVLQVRPAQGRIPLQLATPRLKNINRFYYYQCLLTFVWCCTFLKTINAGLTFTGTKNSDR